VYVCAILAAIQKAKQISHKFACQQQLAIFHRLRHKPTNKPTNKRTNKQTNRPTNEKANERMNKQAAPHKGEQS